MDTNNILSSQLIDIVFDGRNKTYGAYELRKFYKRRLQTALLLMFALVALLFAGILMRSHASTKAYTMAVDEVTITPLSEPEVPLPPSVVPPPVVEPPAVQMERFTPPLIVANEEVTADELPPDISDLTDSKIGLAKQDGDKDLGIVAPPVETRSVVEVVAPKVMEEDYEKVFYKVENPAEFPGGAGEWLRYLQKNLRYPDVAIENGTQGVVKVQFIVDKEGNISEVVALNNPGDGLAEEAVRIIKRGPKWKPAEQNDRKVIYRHIQAITFSLQL